MIHNSGQQRCELRRQLFLRASFHQRTRSDEPMIIITGIAQFSQIFFLPASLICNMLTGKRFKELLSNLIHSFPYKKKIKSDDKKERQMN